MSDNDYPPNWDADRVRDVIEYYEARRDDALDEEPELEGTTLFAVPVELVPLVRRLVALWEAEAGCTSDENAPAGGGPVERGGPESIKQAVVDLVERLPKDATLEEIVARIYLQERVRRGIRELDAGESLDHEAVEAEFREDLSAECR